MNKAERKKFRQSSTWKIFRAKLKKKWFGLDVVTGLPLTRDWNLHHINMSHKQYDDLSDENMFMPLNKDTHECVHYLYGIYKKDKSVLLRLQALLDKMYDVNGGR